MTQPERSYSFAAPPMAIGADDLPGVAKAAEECGEYIQVVGKLLATDGRAEHWDGTNLHERLVEEVADVLAAMQYLVEANGLTVAVRAHEKLARFRAWHDAEDRDDATR